MQIAYVDGYIHVWVTEVGKKRLIDGQKAWGLCIKAFKEHFKDEEGEKDWTYNDETKRWIFDDTEKNRVKLITIKNAYFE